MVITESAVASTRLLGLGSKLYPKHHALNAQQRFYSIDSCSLSRVRQKKDCVGGVYVNMLLLNLYFIYATFYFFTYVLPRKPGTRRCLKTTYSIRMYSVPPLLQFVSLQNTDWPFNGSGYQRTHKPDGLLEAACLSFEWHQWKNYCLSRLRWLGCEIYIKSKIGSPLFVKKWPVYCLFTLNIWPRVERMLSFYSIWININFQ